MRAWEAIQRRVPAVAMQLASDRWPAGITGTLCMHPDALNAILLDVDAAWRALRAAPRAALIPPPRQTARRLPASTATPAAACIVEVGLGAAAWEVVRKRSAGALPFEIGGRRGHAASGGHAAAAHAEYSVRYDLVEARVLGGDFSKGQGHPCVVIEVSLHLRCASLPSGFFLDTIVHHAGPRTIVSHVTGATCCFNPAHVSFAGAASTLPLASLQC